MILYLRGNPCVRKVSQYRKRMTANMINLTYLDERPVTEVDRLAINAWVTGGIEAEKKVRDEYFLEK